MAFHTIVRGLCQVGRYVLLAHALGADNTFLPGGHIETGEGAVTCLRRELREEMGLEDVHVGRFLGAIEHTWENARGTQYQINLLFELQIPGVVPPAPPPSREGHLEFVWATPDELEARNLQPFPLIDYIRAGGEGREAFWASTL